MADVQEVREKPEYRAVLSLLFDDTQPEAVRLGALRKLDQLSGPWAPCLCPYAGLPYDKKHPTCLICRNSGIHPTWGEWPDLPEAAQLSVADYIWRVPEKIAKAADVLRAHIREASSVRWAEHRRELDLRTARRQQAADLARAREADLRAKPKGKLDALIDRVVPGRQEARIEAELEELETSPLRWDDWRRRFVGGSISDRVAAAQRLRQES